MKKDHTTGAIQILYINRVRVELCIIHIISIIARLAYLVNSSTFLFGLINLSSLKVHNGQFFPYRWGKYIENIDLVSAVQESQPPKNITDAVAAVRGSQDPLNAANDVKAVKAAVPCSCKNNN